MDIREQATFAEAKEIPGKKEIKLDNNTLIIERTDPYGFYEIRFAKGQIPAQLKGVYTDMKLAERAITKYLAEKKRVPVNA